MDAYVRLRAFSAERGVFWSYNGRLYDLNHGEDRFATGLDVLLAEKEVEQTRERIMRGKRSAAQMGKPGGHPPWGYKVLREEKTGRSINFVFDPDEVHLVREAARAAMGGETLRSIVRRINTPESRPGVRPQTSSALRRALLNPQIAGHRVYQGKVIGDALWEPIIARDDHERLTAFLTDPGRLTRVGGVEPKHLLSGVAMCAVCGSPVGLIGGRTRLKPYYACKGPKGCVSRMQDYADLLVTEAVLAVLENMDPMVFAEEDSAASAALAEIRDLEKRLEAFADSAAEGELSPKMFAKVEQRLVPQIESARKRLQASQRSSAAQAIAGPDARRLWANLEVVDKRSIIRSFFKVTIKPLGRGNKLTPESIEIELLD